MRRLAVILTLLLLPVGGIAGGSSASAAPSCEPYCNDATLRIVNRLDGSGHGAWLATVLDQYGYEARRWAEITRIPRGHGKRTQGGRGAPYGVTSRWAARRLGDGWQVNRP